MEMRQGPGIALPLLQSLASFKRACARLGGSLAAAMHFLVRCRGIPTSRILQKSRQEIGVGVGELMEYGLEKLLGLTGSLYLDPERWFRRHRPSGRQLTAYREQKWPTTAPSFSIVLRLNHTAPRWLGDTLRSIQAQTYRRWQLLAAADGPLSAPVAAILKERALGTLVEAAALSEPRAAALRGDYVCFVEQGDWLEPHALQRFAETVLRDDPDLLYSDEVRTGPYLYDIEAIEARPAFSYDHYLSTAYFKHLIGLRTSLVHAVGGLQESVRAGQDVDLVLRLLERARAVSHVADILYRRREPRLQPPPEPEVVAAEQAAVERHLARLGSPATVQPTDDPACRAIHYPIAPAQRVAIIIPTKNKVELLRQCVTSLLATVPAPLASICVVDHESDEAATQAYLRSLPPDIRVLPYKGVFNFSAINNHAVAQLGSVDHYLFLNNDTEALAPGWLEHMLGLAQRPDVGAVGALLLYANRTVQHAGVQVGMHYAADHAPKGMPAFAADGKRLPGPQGTLLAIRDQSAVTGACVLVSAQAFHAVGGFDEEFAVGFGDIDLCLRLRGHGYKVLIDPCAVLLHHESASRGSGKLDPHPLDSIRFRDRWWDVILRGDLYHSPLHSRYAPYQLKPCIWNRHRRTARTLAVQLPRRAEAAPARAA